MVADFRAVLSATPLNDKTDVPAAEGTGMTPIKLFKDKSLREGLEKIDSPLSFLELFPLQGIPVKLKRNDGCAANPFLVEVKEYSVQTKSVDATLFDLAMHKGIIKEDGVEQEYQGYVPLFGPQDQQLAPLLDTELVKYALTYNATFEIDTIHNQSWLSLLASLFEVAFKKNDEYANQIIEKIYWTLKILPADSGFKQIVEAFKTGNGDALAKIESQALFYLVVYFLHREISNKEECEEYVEKLWISYFSKVLKTKTIPDFVSTEQENNIKDALKKKYTPEFIMKTFYTANALKTHLKTQLEKEIKGSETVGVNAKVILKPSVYTADTNENLSFETTKRLSTLASGTTLNDQDVLNYLAHCSQHSSLDARFSNLLSKDTESTLQTLAKMFLCQDSTSMKLIKRINYQLLDELAVIYYQEFKRLHWDTIPLKKAELEQICADKKIDISTLGYNESNGLCSNCCVNRGCPWFLFVRKQPRSLRSHLGGWQSFLPRGFHNFVKSHPTNTAEDIFDQFIVKGNNSSSMGAAGVTKEQCIAYIQKLKTHYSS